MKPKLSIIIVNYNGAKYLEDCFTSIYKNIANISFEIIVIDNNSKDNSVEFIRQYYPDIRLIQSSENLGFGKANNYGAKISKGDYLLLLNNDTILLDVIDDLLTVFESDKQIGAIGINMLNKNKDYMQAAGNFPSFLSMLKMKNLFRMGKDFMFGDFKKLYYNVDWLSGSFILMPKWLYVKIGGFDEDYFLYVEDVDLCKRISYLGFHRVFMPNYNYVHFVGFNSSRNKLLTKGYRIYLTKHTSGLNRIILNFALDINASIKFIKSQIP